MHVFESVHEAKVAGFVTSFSGPLGYVMWRRNGAGYELGIVQVTQLNPPNR